MSGLLLQFSRFGAVGAIGTAAHYALFIALVEVTGADPVGASTAGALLGALVNYILNRRYTFRSARRHREALPRFLAVAAAGLAFNAGLMLLLVEGLNMHYLLSQVIATLGVLLWNFSANRLWTFGKDVS